MHEPDLEISVRARRWACVIDPALALTTPLGAQLVQRLSAVADVWMVRSFWQVLDASEFYRRDPQAFWGASAAAGAANDREIPGTLALWEQLRARHDLGHCRLFWVSDNLSESTFPDAAPADLIERYERLHQALSARLDPHDELAGTAAFFGLLDSLALAAALGPVRLLTLGAQAGGTAPLSSVCARLGLDCFAFGDGDDPILREERRCLTALLVQAGASALLWAGLPLRVAHVLVPGLNAAAAVAEDGGYDEAGDGLVDEDRPIADLWQGARLFCHDATTMAAANRSCAPQH